MLNVGGVRFDVAVNIGDTVKQLGAVEAALKRLGINPKTGTRSSSSRSGGRSASASQEINELKEIQRERETNLRQRASQDERAARKYVSFWKRAHKEYEQSQKKALAESAKASKEFDSKVRREQDATRKAGLSNWKQFWANVDKSAAESQKRRDSAEKQAENKRKQQASNNAKLDRQRSSAIVSDLKKVEAAREKFTKNVAAQDRNLQKSQKHVVDQHSRAIYSQLQGYLDRSRKLIDLYERHTARMPAHERAKYAGDVTRQLGNLSSRASDSRAELQSYYSEKMRLEKQSAVAQQSALETLERNQRGILNTLRNVTYAYQSAVQQTGRAGATALAPGGDALRRARLAADMGRDLTTGSVASRIPAGLRAQASDALKQSVSESAASVRQAVTNARVAKEAAADAAQSNKLAALSVASVLNAFGAAKAVSAIKEMTLLAGRADTLSIVLRNVGGNAGYSQGQLNLLENRVKKLGITTTAARESIARMAANNLDLAQAARIARLAQDAAIISGNNSSEAFDKISIAVQRLDTRMLRNQGILINLRNEYQHYARANNRIAEDLSAAERQQIAMNAALSQGVRLAGNYEASMTSSFKQFTSMPRFIEEAQREIGESYQDIFGDVVKGINEYLDSIAKAEDGTKEMVAALLAAGAASTTAAAAIGSVGLAFALLGGPVTFGIAAIVAGVGAITYNLVKASAEAANLKRKMEEAFGEGRAKTAEILQVKELRDQMLQLAQATELTEENQRRLQNTVESLIILLPEMEAEIRRLVAANQLLAAVRLIDQSMPAIEQSSNDRVKGYEQEIAAIDKQIQALEQKKLLIEEDAKRVASVGAIPLLQDQQTLDAQKQINDLLAKREELQGRIVGEEKEQNTLLLRQLLLMDQQAENAQELAAEVAGQLRTLKQGMITDDALRAYTDFLNMQSKMSQAVESENQIRQRNELLLAHNLELLKENFAEARKSLEAEILTLTAAGNKTKLVEKQNELAKLNKKEEAEALNLRRASAQTLADDLKRREANLQALKDLNDVFDIIIAKMSNETGLMEKVFSLKQSGLSQEFIDLVMEIDRATEAGQNATDGFVDGARKMRDEILELYKTGRQTEVGGGEFTDERAAAELGGVFADPQVRQEYIAQLRQMADEEQNATRANDLRILAAKLESLAKQETAAKESHKRQLAEQAILTQKMVDYAKELSDRTKDQYENMLRERIEILGLEERHTLESVRRIIQTRQREEETVSGFLRNLRSSLINDEAEGFSQIQSLYDTFVENINQASVAQLDEINNIMGQAFNQQLNNSTDSIQQLTDKLAKTNSDMQQLIQESQARGAELMGQGFSQAEAQAKVQQEMGQKYNEILQEQSKAQEDLNNAQSGRGILDEAVNDSQNRLRQLIEQRRELFANGDLQTMDQLREQEAALQQQELARNTAEINQLWEIYRAEQARLEVMIRQENVRREARGEQPLPIPQALAQPAQGQPGAPPQIVPGAPVAPGANNAQAPIVPGAPAAVGGPLAANAAAAAGQAGAGQAGAGQAGAGQAGAGQAGGRREVDILAYSDALFSKVKADVFKDGLLRDDVSPAERQAFWNWERRYNIIRDNYFKRAQTLTNDKWKHLFDKLAQDWPGMLATAKRRGKNQPKGRNAPVGAGQAGGQFNVPTDNIPGLNAGAQAVSTQSPSSPFSGGAGDIVGSQARLSEAMANSNTAVIETLKAVESSMNTMTDAQVEHITKLNELKSKIVQSDSVFRDRMSRIR